jgi:hypothetical protein
LTPMMDKRHADWCHLTTCSWKSVPTHNSLGLSSVLMLVGKLCKNNRLHRGMTWHVSANAWCRILATDNDVKGTDVSGWKFTVSFNWFIATPYRIGFMDTEAPSLGSLWARPKNSYYSMIKFFLLAILASLIFKALHTREVPL